LVDEVWTGELELIISPQLLAELEGVLMRQKFRRYFDLASVRHFIDLLRHQATVAPDPDEPGPLRSVDPKDDYLIALAFSQSVRLVSGDSHLLDLADRAPICSPADLLGTPA
jgi:putative PIN family toxin of toxin-antitoxin system